MHISVLSHQSRWDMGRLAIFNLLWYRLAFSVYVYVYVFASYWIIKLHFPIYSLGL